MKSMESALTVEVGDDSSVSLLDLSSDPSVKAGWRKVRYSNFLKKVALLLQQQRVG